MRTSNRSEMYVFDATPLIYLAKVDSLTLVRDLSRSAVIPEPVYGEVVTCGLEAGHPDARRIERAVEGGVFETVPVPDTETFERLRENDRLSKADAAVLAAAEAEDGTAVMDERYGRDVADTEAIETRSTAYVVLRGLKAGAHTASEARETIDGMLEAGWYCSPALYAAIRRKIDELARATESGE